MDAKARKQFPQHNRPSFAYSAGGGWPSAEGRRQSGGTHRYSRHLKKYC
jgi:hypothetical protein